MSTYEIVEPNTFYPVKPGSDSKLARGAKWLDGGAGAFEWTGNSWYVIQSSTGNVVAVCQSPQAAEAALRLFNS